MTRRISLPRESRYTQTQLTQVRGDGNELLNTYVWNVWRPIKITLSRDDVFYRVKDSDVGRLDLVAVRTYGKSELWWVIAYVNDIKDPLQDVEVGSLIRLPSLRRIQEAIYGLKDLTHSRSGAEVMPG